jgi:hypothetical protein
MLFTLRQEGYDPFLPRREPASEGIVKETFMDKGALLLVDRQNVFRPHRVNDSLDVVEHD